MREIKSLLLDLLQEQQAMLADLRGDKNEMRIEAQQAKFEAQQGDTNERLARLEARQSRVEDELISLGFKMDHVTEKWVETDREIYRMKRLRTGTPE